MKMHWGSPSDNMLCLTLSISRVINFNFHCSLIRNYYITQHEELGFKSLLRWKMTILYYQFSLNHLYKVGRMYFWTWEWKGYHSRILKLPSVNTSLWLSHPSLLTNVNVFEELSPLDISRNLGVGVVLGQHLHARLGQLLRDHAVEAALKLACTDWAVTERVKVLEEFLDLSK